MGNVQAHLRMGTKRLAIILLAILVAIACIPTTAFADYTAGSTSLAPQSASTATGTEAMHRLYNPNSGEHFYTANVAERNHLMSVGWRYEGAGWQAPMFGEDVYRLYNPNAGDHHYTLSAPERNHLMSVGWRYEGVGWCSAPSSTGIPVYREYNPNARAGAHNFTTNYAEDSYLASVGWRAEGVAWFGATSATSSAGGSPGGSAGAASGGAPAAKPEPEPEPAPEPYAAQYSYEIYNINATYDTILTKWANPIYIKTDNPKLESIGLYCNGYDAYSYSNTHYEDVTYTPAADDPVYRYDLYRVPGGYVAHLKLSEAGLKTVEVREYRGDRRATQPSTIDKSSAVRDVDYALIGTFQVDAVDFEQSRSDWQDWLIETSCTNDMTPVEKMRAIVQYLGFNGHFKYHTVKEDRMMVHYAQYPNTPYWLSHRWTSFTSPDALCSLADRIGGFEDVHDCYYDYPAGSTEWSYYHYFCRVTYEGKDYYFESCPSLSTGIMHPEDHMIDFDDMSGFVKLFDSVG